MKRTSCCTSSTRPSRRRTPATRARNADPRMDRQAGHRAAEPDRARPRAAVEDRRNRPVARSARTAPVHPRRARARRVRALLGAGAHAAARSRRRVAAGAKQPAFARLAAAWHADTRGAVRRRDGGDRRADRACGVRSRAARRRRIARLARRSRQGDRTCERSHRSGEAGGDAHAVRTARRRHSRQHRPADRDPRARRPRRRRSDGAPRRQSSPPTRRSTSARRR